MITAYFTSLDGLDRAFAILAAIGLVLFVVRAALMLLGMGHHDVDFSGADGGHFDLQCDHGGDVHHGDASSDADSGFRLFSLQTLTAFFLIAGLTGLALHRGSHLGPVVSVLGALAGGFAIMFVIAWMMSLFLRLQTSGTIDLRSAIGEQGTIYLTIPKGGTGQARLCVQSRLRIIDAVSEPPCEIKTGDPVEVVDVLEGRTLVVRKIDAPPPAPTFWNLPVKE